MPNTLKIAMDTPRQAEIQIKQTRIITDDKHVYNVQKEAKQRNYGGQQRSTMYRKSGSDGIYRDRHLMSFLLVLIS